MASRVRTNIALQVRGLREQRGLNQTEYAQLLGKPQSVLSRLENTAYGKVSVQTLLDIAHALDVALVVRFCGYDEFFRMMGDVSPNALRVQSFEEGESSSSVGAENISEGLANQISGDPRRGADCALAIETPVQSSPLDADLRNLFSGEWSGSRQPARRSVTEATAA